MAQESKEPGRLAACAKVWGDPASFATTLVTLFHDQFYDPDVPPGENCYAWHPGTILLEIRDAFRVELPPANFDRLMAGISLVTSDEFYKSLPSFVSTANILSGDLFDPGSFDPADAAECAWGISEALLLSPPDEDDDAPFSGAIRAYIGMVLDQEGIVDPPDVLRLGTRSHDAAAKAATALEGDPATYAEMRRLADEKSREIEQIVRDGLHRLVGQLEKLPLARGDTRELVTKLSRGIR